jgi:membrane fusion protein, multidrug efflux system
VLKAIRIARDLGREIEIAAGLQADDRVILNPPDGLVEGTQVRITKSGP